MNIRVQEYAKASFVPVKLMVSNITVRNLQRSPNIVNPGVDTKTKLRLYVSQSVSQDSSRDGVGGRRGSKGSKDSSQDGVGGRKEGPKQRTVAAHAFPVMRGLSWDLADRAEGDYSCFFNLRPGTEVHLEVISVGRKKCLGVAAIKLGKADVVPIVYDAELPLEVPSSSWSAQSTGRNKTRRPSEAEAKVKRTP